MYANDFRLHDIARSRYPALRHPVTHLKRLTAQRQLVQWQAGLEG